MPKFAAENISFCLSALAFFYLPEPIFNDFPSSGQNISEIIDDFYKCLLTDDVDFCLKESWSVPLQLEVAYLKILRGLNVRREFFDCAQHFYTQELNSTAKFALHLMSNKINTFQTHYINSTFYCTYVNLIEQPVFCSLESRCAMNKDERLFLQIEYARRYIRVMMAQPDQRNKPFNEDQMKLCNQIAYPHLVGDPDKIPEPIILLPNVADKNLKILNLDLCSCEYCSASLKILPIQLLIFIVLINLFY